MWLGDFIRWFIGPLIGLTFAFVVFVTSIFGNYVIVLTLPMITLLDRHRQWRELMDRAVSFWMVIPLVSFNFCILVL